MSDAQVLVDASCDVPEAVLLSAPVSVLPIRLSLQSGRRTDRRQLADTLAFYRELELAGPPLGRTEPMEAHEIAGFLKARLLAHGNPVLALHVSSTRSMMFNTVREVAAGLAVPSDNRPAPKIRVLDSGNLFAGYGVQLVDLLEHRARGLDWHELVRVAERNANRAHAYLVPARLDFIARHSLPARDRSVGFVARMAARVLNMTPILHGHFGATRLVGRRIGAFQARELLFARMLRMIEQQRLASPHVVLSYAGNIAEVELMPGYQRLVGTARQHGVTVHLCTMAMVNGIHVGPRALSVGFLAGGDGSDGLDNAD